MKYKITSILCVALLLLSCGKSTEVTIVDESTSLLPGEKSTSVKSDTSAQDGFTVFKIGESNSIKTLDPLFANNSSELRVNSLIYDGLTELSDDGTVEPGLANKWTISRDSLRYTFTLNTNVFYHDNTRFTSGLGRQVNVRDIVLNFERMASISVPDNAANLFSSIRGFKRYHIEQTYTKNPSDRTINSIEGLSVTNDSTIVFVLQEKDSDFLKKLAHPFASVYPKESLQADKSPIYEAIGTGGYYVAQRKANLLILASNNDYFKSQNVPTRLDIMHGINEPDLYQRFAKGELDALIEPAPETVIQVADSTGNIDPIFKSVFDIKKSETNNSINFYYNSASGNDQLRNYIGNQNAGFLTLDSAIGNILINKTTQPVDSLDEVTAYIAFSDNPADVFLIDKVAEKLSALGINVVMNSSYAVTDDITFSTRNFPSSIPALIWKFPVYILSKPNVSGVNISAQPWNISFEGAKISSVQ